MSKTTRWNSVSVELLRDLGVLLLLPPLLSNWLRRSMRGRMKGWWERRVCACADRSSVSYRISCWLRSWSACWASICREEGEQENRVNLNAMG